VTLDLTAGLDTPNAYGTMTVVAGLNFLGDETVGTGPSPGEPLVVFVQGFDVTASYGNLGARASQSNFHARPGMDLTNNGDITLASNWNLGAGVVDVTKALHDGLMTTTTATGLPAILAG